MRGIRTRLAVLAACAACVSPARAGVYISSESLPQVTPLNGENGIRSWRLNLQSVANPRKNAPDSYRSKYLQVAAGLESRARDGTATVLDRADLGGCYLRLGRPDDAVRVLRDAGDDNFLVLTNLAVAYQSIGLLGRAVLAQKQALDRWPAVWAGWTPEQWYVNRRVESYYYALLLARSREAVPADGRPAPVQTMDALFPGVRYVGPGGDYAAGRIDPALLDRLPPDAPWIVRNLLWSLPFDDRLYWQLGELLNSRGEVENALTVFNDLVSAREWSNVRELMRHRQVLRERAAELEALRRSPLVRNNPLTPLLQENLFWSLTPRGSPGVPVGGALAHEAAWWAAAGYFEILQGEERLGRPLEAADVAAAPSAPDTPPTPPPAWLPDWRQLGVGFVSGAVVAALAALQWGEWRRRRQAAARHRGETVPGPGPGRR